MIKLKKWSISHVGQLVMMNVLLVLLLLLKSAGYFSPYLILTINLIVMFSLVYGVTFLGLSIRGVMSIGLFFWFLSAVLRILKVDIWAERSSVYAFETLLVVLALLTIEIIRNKWFKKSG